MRSHLFPIPHTRRNQVLSTLRDVLEKPDVAEPQRQQQAADCLDTYLQEKDAAQVLSKGNKLLLGALAAFTPPLRERFGQVLIPAVQRRRPDFADALQLAKILDTEALATQRAVAWLQQNHGLDAQQLTSLNQEIGALVHSQGINDGMAFALGRALSAEQMQCALGYYTSDDGQSFIKKLPHLMALQLNANVGPVGLLDSVLGSALRPETPDSDPKLLKMQRILALCPHTSTGGELARKMCAEASVHLFSEAELDAALGYWQSDAAQHVNQAYETFNETIRPRLVSGEYAESFAEITQRVCKD